MIAVISGLVALTVWTPYLLKALSGATAESGTAMHYLPDSGAVLPFPMLSFTLVGGTVPTRHNLADFAVPVLPPRPSNSVSVSLPCTCGHCCP